MLSINSNKMRLNDGYDISLKKKKINWVKKKIKKYRMIKALIKSYSLQKKNKTF